MALAELVGLAGGLEPLDGKLADGLEHPEAAAVGSDADEALVDQRLEGVEVSVDDLFGRLEGPAAAEDGQAGEQALLVGGQQLVGPLDRGAQGALALRSVAAAAGEERQTLLQALEQGLWAEDLDAC